MYNISASPKRPKMNDGMNNGVGGDTLHDTDISNLHPLLREMLVESIAVNSTASLEVNADTGKHTCSHGARLKCTCCSSSRT